MSFPALNAASVRIAAVFLYFVIFILYVESCTAISINKSTFAKQNGVSHRSSPTVHRLSSANGFVHSNASRFGSGISGGSDSTSPRSILLDLWSSTQGSDWKNKTNWNSTAAICVWFGITCDDNQNVINIQLTENNLVGTLPETLSNLTSLQILSVRHNDISGGMPTWLCQLLLLKIIDFSYTRITGPILDCWQSGAALSQLIVQNTAVTGTLPPSLGNLQSLWSLDLRGTQVTGPFPDSWQHLTSLTQLRLTSCPLQTVIPTWLGSLLKLQQLYLGSTDLFGTIPVELGNLRQLEELVLTINLRLIGTVPAELSNLSLLRALVLSTTGLSGEIPPSFSQLTQLQVLALDASSFTGNPFPSFPPSVLDLSVANSKFVATLDADFCKMTQLQTFITSYSPGISGAMPACIGNMTQLSKIYMDHCSFTGALPKELFSLGHLQMLDLRSNGFSGVFPQEFGQLTQLNQVDLANNLLTGSLPQSMSQLSQLELVALENNLLDGEFDLAWLPPSLLIIDFSGNNISFTALSACATSVRSVAGYNGPLLSITELLMSGNPINMPFGDVMKCLSAMTPALINLVLESTGVSGGLQFEDISKFVPAAGGVSQMTYAFSALITVTIPNNLLNSVSVVNTLAAIGTVLIIDASNNQMIGSIENIASNPQRLLLGKNPGLRGTPTDNSTVPGWGPRFLPPAFVTIEYSNLNHNDTAALLCPAFVGGTGQEFQVDPSYLNWQHCQCESGYHRTLAPEGNWCDPCPLELACSTAMYAPVHAVSNGFYPSPLPLSDYNSNSSLLLSNAVMVPCQFAGRCNPSTQTQYQCAYGSDPNALLCSRCLFGFFESGGACQKCATWARWLVPIILLLCALGFLLIQMGILVAEERAAGQSKRVSSSSLSQLPVGTEPRATAIQIADAADAYATVPGNEEHTSTLLIILTFWLQSQHTLSYLSDNGSSVSSSSSGWIHYASSTASLTPLGLECIVYGWDWPSQWWLIVLSPVWMIFLAALTFVIGRLHPIQQRLMVWLHRDSRKATLVTWRRMCFRLLLSLWSLTYMGVAQMILSSWRCERVTTPDPTSSFSFMTAAPYVNCGSRQHTNMLIVGIIMFVSFTFMLPMSMLWYSWQQRKHWPERDAMLSPSFRNARELKGMGADEHPLSESLLSSSISAADSDERISKTLPEVQESGLNVQSVLATTACSGLRSDCWQWQTVITGRKLILAAIVTLMPRGSSIAPLLAIVMLLALLLSHTWIRPFQSRSNTSPESGWLWSQATRLGRDFNLLEACLLLQVSALFLAQVLAAAAASQQQLLATGASLRTQAGVVPTLLDLSTLEVVRQIILGIGIALVSAAVMQTAWRLYKHKTRAAEIAA